MTRRRFALALAILASLAGVLAPAAAAPTFAAGSGLTIVSDATYLVDPDNSAVHVTVNLTAVNHLKDTKTRLYFFDRAFIAVPPNTSGFKISARSSSPSVHVAASKADHTLLRIDFGKHLPAGSSRGMTLTFDITDPGGEPTRTTRIGASLVAFGAWAYASETGGSTVKVVFPPGYTIEARSDQLGEPTTDADGRTIYATGKLAQPLSFFAYFVADKPSAFSETTRTVVVDGRDLPITIRSWPDDPAWAERTTALVEQSVPLLSEAIGLPWLAGRQFVVREATSQSGASYAGRYDPKEATVEIAYYASPLVTLHETAHAWFDGGLLADRWANEGFAEWYARDAAAKLGMEVAPTPLTPEQQAEKIPLNAWKPLGLNAAPAEDYGFAASAELARLIAERAGPAGLASVWNAAREGVAAYQPAGLRPPGEGMPGETRMPGSDVPATEMRSGPPDWRGLLDLLEDRTGKKYDDLWRAWVVRHEEATLLDARSEARRQYDAVMSRAGDWQLPAIVRDSMRAWQFDQAIELLTAANAALDARDEVLAAASAAKLTVPHALEAAFEGDRGFAAASGEADAELAAIEAYGMASSVRPKDPGVVEQVGLWGHEPTADLTTAAEAFAAGDLRGSVEASASAYNAWDSARDTGRNRIMLMLSATIAALVAVALVVNGIRSVNARRVARRSRTAASAAAAAASSGPPSGSPGPARPTD
ncbi:MAG TPA: hypothetical protein VFV72_02235 [Candidatus Limnocylindrales bacterium]|nr:hypothetical protein [Candidatus Limnocylindrales bacterium]